MLGLAVPEAREAWRVEGSQDRSRRTELLVPVDLLPVFQR